MSLRKFCVRLTQKYGATVLTEIYQGSSPKNLGGGVCRAVVAHWIAANLQAMATEELGIARAFREKAEELKTGKSAESFITHQKDYDFHLKTYETARAEYKELARARDLKFEEFKKQVDKESSQTGLKQTLSQRLRIDYTLLEKKTQEAYDEAMEQSKRVHGYKTMFMAEPQPQRSVVLGMFIMLLSSKCAQPGFYFVGIGGTGSGHAWGFYVSHNLSSVVFIDPNTCEWVFPDIATAANFLAEYVDNIKTYKKWSTEHCTIDYVPGAMLYEPLP